MPHEAQPPVPLSLNTPTGIDRLTDDELSAFREQFRALNESARSGLDDLADDCIPSAIGRFRILRRLGSGTFGCVYEAYDSRLSRKVAVKVSHLGVHTSQQTRSRFVHEAQAAARLAHPNVVCLHEYGEEQGLLYLVYEMCDGLTLEDWIVSQTAPVPVCTAVGIVRELAKGLSHAHLRGLVHRDVKPQNVLLTPNYDDQSRLPFIPRITDFGLAHHWTAEHSKSLSARLVGTFATMSPEQARGDIRHVTPAADQYSLGIILYRLLTGRVPFEGDDVVRTLQRICNEHPRSPRSLRPEVSRDLEAVVMTCLSKRPEARYATCKELARELDRVLRGTPVAARPLRSYQRAWRLLCATPVVSSLSLAIFVGSIASAITFSMLASSLRSQRQELQRSVQDLTISEAAAVRARQETELALAAVTDQKLLAEQQRAHAVNQAYRADLHRAYEAWDEKQVLSTIDMLDRIRSTTQGFMDPCFGFQLLAHQAEQSAKRLGNHSGPATEVSYISGADLVVSADQKGELKFHDVHTGKLEFQVVPQANTAIDAIAVSADGRFMAIGLNSPKMLSPCVRIYPLELNDKENWLGAIHSTFYATTTVESLRFSPCGRYLALGQRYEPVMIHELATGKLLASVPTDNRNRSVDFSVDGELCLIVGKENSLLLANTQTGHVAQTLHCDQNPQFACFSPQSNWLAYTAYNDSNVYLTSHAAEGLAGSGQTIVLPQPRGIVTTLDFSQDGRWLVAGTRRGGVVKWDLAALTESSAEQPLPSQIECTADYVSHGGEVTDVCSVGETHIASVSDGGSIVLNPLSVTSVNRRGSDVTSAVVVGHQDAAQILQGTFDGRVVLADFASECHQTLCAPTNSPVTTTCRSPDGQRVAVGWRDGRLALVDLTTQRLMQCEYSPTSHSRDQHSINSVCFSDDGSLLAACGDDARLRLWKVADPSQPCWETTLSSYAYATCFCGPQHIAVGGMFEDIWLFEIADGQPAFRLSGASRTVSLLFDASRERLVSGHVDGRIRIHSGKKWDDVHTLNGDAGKISCLVGSPDGGCYISGDSLGLIKVWSADHLELIGNLHTLAGAPTITSIELDQQRQELMVFFATQPPATNGPWHDLHCVRLSGH